MKRFVSIVLFVLVSLQQVQARLCETVLNPVRVVWVSDSLAVRNHQVLTSEFCGQVSVANRNTATLDSRHGARPALLLDFGKEIYGRIKIYTGIRSGNDAVLLRVRFGESVSEAMSDLHDATNRHNATNDHSLRDFTLETPWLGSVECGNTGFRFVRLDLIDPDVTLPLNAVQAIAVERDDPMLGTFTCDNQRLNDIWKIAARTVQLNMQDYVWDGIKRDRLVWIGDMHPEVMTINNVWGDSEVVRRSLDFARADTPLPGWMNGMCAYSLWWILIQRDLYMYTGNLDYLREQLPYLTGLVKQIDGCVDSEGMEHLTGTRFIDWPTSENEEVIHTGLQALTVMALDAANQIGEVLNANEVTDVSSQCLSRLRRVRLDAHGNSQAAALNVLSGLSENPEKDCRTIINNGADGFTTFFGYYMLEALARQGHYTEAMELISTYWGAMLDLGATSFWEDLKYSDTQLTAARIDELVPDGYRDIHADGGDYCYKGLRLSLCHGWASGPAPWLIRHILGVKPLEPACRVIEVKPNLADLNEVSGTFPTPRGVVEITARRTPDGKVKTSVKAPKGIKVIK